MAVVSFFLEEDCVESNKACLQWSGVAHVRVYLFNDSGSTTPAFYMVSWFLVISYFFIHVDLKLFSKGNLYCYDDSAAREILGLCF